MSAREITELKKLLATLPNPDKVHATAALETALRTSNILIKKVAKARVLSYLAKHLPNDIKKEKIIWARNVLRRI